MNRLSKTSNQSSGHKTSLTPSITSPAVIANPSIGENAIRATVNTPAIRRLLAENRSHFRMIPPCDRHNQKGRTHPLG
ncbi:hypothetical protein RB1713 [Rhodopirellula baltica SH 1]|uniref:Uncharacterized protein n=1 Tax=Rhodopirellula baltica (strain DSM 10527 / NCIMB 13988 / SH1) TaxID=243090 RepID=Q7UWY1_RHOBA|nr:hypothetical protein RB1713 [Rhodopirellula baltica SH 1]